jgi:hypothetical protein
VRLPGLLLLLLLAFAAAPAAHASMCINDSLSNYILLAGAGCSIGDLNGSLTVKNFSYNQIGGTVTIDAGDIMVIPLQWGTRFR